LGQVCSYLWVLPYPPPKKKTDYQDITEILLKVALNTITLTPLSGNKKITQKMVTVTKKKIENSLIDHYCWAQV
jgi:hypothetical protein